MKRLCTTIALALITAGATMPLFAADATVALDAASAYVWRGLTFNDGFVLQPSLDVSANGFGLNVWANMDIDDYDGAVEEGEFSEVDLTASYAFTMGAVDGSIGIIEYLFPAGGVSTTEVYAGFGMDLGAGFSASTTLYYDIDQVEDYYMTIGLGYSMDVSKIIALGLSADLGYAGEDFVAAYSGGTDGGLFNYVVGASLDVAVTEAVSVAAFINYTDSLDDDTLPDESVDTTIYGGISVSCTF